MVELLAIVHAEEAAESLLKEAQERREQAIHDALTDREYRLQNIKPPTPVAPDLKPAKPDTRRIEQLAKTNRRRAVKRILEAIHA